MQLQEGEYAITIFPGRDIAIIMVVRIMSQNVSIFIVSELNGKQQSFMTMHGWYSINLSIIFRMIFVQTIKQLAEKSLILPIKYCNLKTSMKLDNKTIFSF